MEPTERAATEELFLGTTVVHASEGGGHGQALWATVVGYLYIMIGTVAALLNGLLATLIVIKKMYVADNRFIFVLGLCVVDMFTGVALVLQHTLRLLGTEDPHLCQASVMFLQSAGYVAAWGVFILTLDQFLHIQFPLTYDVWMTPGRVRLIMSSPILLSVFNIILVNILWRIRSSCNFFSEVPFWTHVMQTTFYIATLLLTSALQVVCFCVAYSHLRRIGAMEEVNRNMENQEPHANPVSQMKAVKTLGAVLGTCLFCWMPIAMCNISFGFDLRKLVRSLVLQYAFNSSALLFYLNIILNPVVYAFRFSELKSSITALLKCKGSVGGGETQTGEPF